MPEVRFLQRLEGAPKARTQIFSLDPPRASVAALRKFATRFDVDPKRGVLQQDPARFTYTDGPHLFTLYRASGALRYQDQSRWQRDDGEANLKIGDEEATKLALNFVRKFKLVPTNESELLTVSRLRVGSLGSEGKPERDRVIDVGVAFQRKIGGVPVDGPGGKLIIYLDHKGEMTGFDRIWRSVKGRYRPVKALKDPRAAEEDMRRYWRGHESGRIDVREVRFGYFELGPQEAQRFLQPAYILLLTLVSPQERVMMNSAHVVPAAVNAVGSLMPSPKKPVRQAPRS